MRLLKLCVIISLLGVVHGYSTGAPDAGCDQMIPTGHGVPAQITSSPYAVHLSTNQYSCAGQEVTVTVNGTSQFKGFLCQPRSDPNSYVTYGSLTATGSIQTKNNCGTNAALTHSDATPKSAVSFKWRAPVGERNLQIVCTVVQSKTVFWVKTASSTISYVKGQCSAASRSQLPIYTLAATFLLFALFKKYNM